MRLRVIQVIRWDDQAVAQAEAIKLARMTNTSTAILRMDCSFLFVTKAVLIYARVFELQCRVLFQRAHIKDVVGKMMQLRDRPEQPRSSYIRYMRFCRQMTKNSDGLPLLESQNDNRDSEKEQRKLHLDSGALPASRACFIVLLVEADAFHINNPINFTVFRAFRFYRFGEQLLQKLFVGFNESLKNFSFHLLM